jgi:hypothetical protein
MSSRSKTDGVFRPLALTCSALCLVGALAAMFVVLVRVPALSSTKLEVLQGTLQGTAVSLLFGVVALLVNLTYIVHRANRLPGGSLASDSGAGQGSA